MRELTEEEENRFDVKLRHWYPLGQINALWHLIEDLDVQLKNKFVEEIDALFDALQELDSKVRADRYSFPKKSKKSKRIKNKSKL